LQAVTKGLGQNDAASFIEGELGGHDGSMVWEKPIVNGIWEKREEAGSRAEDGERRGKIANRN
jgi:hypothetical protein